MRREIFDRKVSYYFDEADKNLDGELGFKDFAYLLDDVNGEKDSGYEDYILEDAMYSVNSMDSRFDGVLKGPVSFMSFRSFVSNVSGFAKLDKWNSWIVTLIHRALLCEFRKGFHKQTQYR